MPSTLTKPAHVGDIVEVVGHHVGEARRLGTIVEILGDPARAHYRIAWEDGRESVLYPGGDFRVVPARRKQR
ncbi:MAG TPA: DUF1918 domain-containing protein [Gaiellaceae bacterium]|nr:DUF1918 domain-containing protein [Gaiellaceae bacterium]